MPVADPSFGWQEALAAYTIVGVVAFLVAWVATDLAHAVADAVRGESSR